MDVVMKTIWRALSDILLDVDDVFRTPRPESHSHLHHKEKGGNYQDGIDHLLLRDQVHEEADNEEALDRGNRQGNRNIDGRIVKIGPRRQNGENGSDHQPKSDDLVLADMPANGLDFLRIKLAGRTAHSLITVNIKSGI